VNQKVEVIRCHDCNELLTDESVFYVKINDAPERPYCDKCVIWHTTRKPDVAPWIIVWVLKMILFSLLIALGVLTLIFAGKDFDEAGGLVFVGVPAVIIGIILVIKGTQELLSR
jgi:hypothetical protein